MFKNMGGNLIGSLMGSIDDKNAEKAGEVLEKLDAAAAKELITKKLTKYQEKIQRVQEMIKDPIRTRFIIVCIAEYLSINESQRLLRELDNVKVTQGGIVVNQLVEDFFDNKNERVEMRKLKKIIAPTGEKNTEDSKALLKKIDKQQG